jgi:2-dehydropantoate 2-reductase
MRINTIGVIGVGGVGGYVGGLLGYQAAQHEPPVRHISFIARGEHLRQIQQHGLILNTSEQSGLVCRPSYAADTLTGLPVPDLYLICVKSYDLDNVMQALAGHINETTILLPLLNGVDIYERIRAIVGTGIVLPACAYVATHIERPGVVTQKGKPGIIFCGPDPAHPDLDPQDMIACFHDAHLNFNWQADPYPAIWEKYLFIAAFGLVTASSGKSLGEVMDDATLQQTVGDIMQEIVAIAAKKGVRLPENALEAALSKAHNFPHEARTSYQRDVETPGKSNEGDLFGGTILRLGKQLDVPTPVTGRLFATL